MVDAEFVDMLRTTLHSWWEGQITLEYFGDSVRILEKREGSYQIAYGYLGDFCSKKEDVLFRLLSLAYNYGKEE